jgi:hypothetical protein
MPRLSAARKTFDRLARRRSTGYPIATVAYYGPDDQYATKVAVGIIGPNDKVIALERWLATTQDVRRDEHILQQMIEFIEHHQAVRIGVADRIIGCPHEEGIDYPEGESCPHCPFWKGRDRWTGEDLR